MSGGILKNRIKQLKAQNLRPFEIGLVLWKEGFQPLVTHDISESPSYGYGEPDEWGYWEYQAPGPVEKVGVNTRDEKNK